MEKLSSCPICESKQIDSYIQTKAQMHPSAEEFNFDRCGNCGLVFLNPRPDMDEMKDYYTDYYLPYRGAEAWGKYAKLVESSQDKTDEKRVKWIQKTQRLNTQSVVLDIGCGKPTFLEKCRDTINCRTIGLDFSDEGWKGDKSRYNGIDLLTGEVKDLNIHEFPDVITMWHYLEHDYHPMESLKTLKKFTKTTTRLLIEVPNFESESRKKYGKHWAGWHSPRHLSLFSPANLSLLLEKCGWEVEKIRKYGTLDPYVLEWMSKMEEKGMDWNKNMEEEFTDYVKGMIAFAPKKWSQRHRSLGLMSIVAKIKV